MKDIDLAEALAAAQRQVSMLEREVGDLNRKLQRLQVRLEAYQATAEFMSQIVIRGRDAQIDQLVQELAELSQKGC